eukprot:CAMPEP_0178383170 /NCGR_PEP_ID=MMETSP0689_2-20121128/6865_1 /TAXON_ID=160604 /ORGANISM="Amphidinium massartii, Strain CS-259" /LENGTH=281 /DNA_ID=CAMNT_0020003385 /DNA_START=267 /DNA_END=1112 /DNA_ORIENTATION=-
MRMQNEAHSDLGEPASVPAAISLQEHLPGSTSVTLNGGKKGIQLPHYTSVLAHESSLSLEEKVGTSCPSPPHAHFSLPGSEATASYGLSSEGGLTPQPYARDTCEKFAGESDGTQSPRLVTSWSRQSTTNTLGLGPWSRQTSLHRQDSEGCSSTNTGGAQFISPPNSLHVSSYAPGTSSSTSSTYNSLMQAKPGPKSSKDNLKEEIMPGLREALMEDDASEACGAGGTPVSGVICGLEFKVAHTFLHFQPDNETVKTHPMHRSSSLPADLAGHRDDAEDEE